MLLVHAHPDDETIVNGATMAAAVRAGATVTLLTCTRGEHGEVAVADLADLYGDPDGRLARHREGELAKAMAALGVTDHRFLAGPAGHRHFRDSGMTVGPGGVIGAPADAPPDCLWRADLLVTAGAVAAVVREVRPHVLVAYDELGGYGHPDHVAAHRAAMYGAQLAAAPWRPDLGAPWTIPKIYWSTVPRGVALAGLAAAGAGLPPGQTADPLRSADPGRWFAHPAPADYPATDDALVTTRIDASSEVSAKTAALRAHATQLTVSGDRFALTNGIALPISGVEYYRLVAGSLGADRDGGFETDLFAGLDGLTGPDEPAEQVSR